VLAVVVRLRRSFNDGAVAVKIWKNIGMAIKANTPPTSRCGMVIRRLRLGR